MARPGLPQEYRNVNSDKLLVPSPMHANVERRGYACELAIPVAARIAVVGGLVGVQRGGTEIRGQRFLLVAAELAMHHR